MQLGCRRSEQEENAQFSTWIEKKSGKMRGEKMNDTFNRESRVCVCCVLSFSQTAGPFVHPTGSQFSPPPWFRSFPFYIRLRWMDFYPFDPWSSTVPSAKEGRKSRGSRGNQLPWQRQGDMIQGGGGYHIISYFYLCNSQTEISIELMHPASEWVRPKGYVVRASNAMQSIYQYKRWIDFSLNRATA